MTIGSYIVRMLVALFLGVSFIVTVLIYAETKRYGGRPDLAFYISLGVFLICAVLLWIMK